MSVSDFSDCFSWKTVHAFELLLAALTWRQQVSVATGILCCHSTYCWNCSVHPGRLKQQQLVMAMLLPSMVVDVVVAAAVAAVAAAAADVVAAAVAALAPVAVACRCCCCPSCWVASYLAASCLAANHWCCPQVLGSLLPECCRKLCW